MPEFIDFSEHHAADEPILTNGAGVGAATTRERWPAVPLRGAGPEIGSEPEPIGPSINGLGGVSLVIPTKNEARNLGWVLAQIPDCVDEVVLVDASRDATRTMAKACRPDIRVVEQTAPGKGNALRAGFQACTGEVVVMMDADGSMSPAEIPYYLYFLANGFDFVKGSRFVAGGGSLDITRFRQLGNRVLMQIANRLYDGNLTDLCYGFCAFHLRYLDDLQLSADGFEIETQMTVHALQAGLRIAEVPSLELPRRSGRSNLHAIRDGRRVLGALLRDHHQGTSGRLVQAALRNGLRCRRIVTISVAPVPLPTGPVLLDTVDLECVSDGLPASDRYRSARLLVRLHGVPLGELHLELGPDGISADQLADQVERRFAAQICSHLEADGPSGDGCSCQGALGRARQTARRASVVVASRDRTESLLRCLRTIAALDYPSFDVVVVDSAPRSDTTAQALRTRDWPFELTYLRAAKPGLARAHNQALAAVTGEVVAFTDDDVVVDADWLGWMVAGFDEPQVLAVTGLILPAELETPAQVRLEQSGGFGRGFLPRRFSLTDPPATPLFPFATGALGSGANMAFRTSWLRQRGGFDPATGAGTAARGGDDLLAFLQVLYDSGTLVYRPEAMVRHHHHRSVDALSRQAFGYGVGTGAYVAAALRERPDLVGAMLRRVPSALRQFIRPATTSDAAQAGFGADLTWRRCLGLLCGPAAYALSRARLSARWPEAVR